MRINATLASVQSAKPAKAFGQLATTPLKSGEQVGILRAAIPADVPDDAIVTKADLVFHTREAWSGSIVFSAQRQSEPWSVSKVTWNNRPAVVSGSSKSVTVASPPVNREFRIDVADHAQAFVAGSAINRGWRITADAGNSRDIYGATAGKHKPYLDLEYVIPGDAPTGLVPDGAAVSIPKPTLTFPVPDDTVAIRVQIDDNADGVSPAHDSLEVPATVGLYDLATSSYAGLADGATTYWRAWTKGPLGWSLPSDWATMPRVSKPTVVITSPGPTTGDKTPPCTWTAPGQVIWHARLLDAAGRVLDDSDPTASADTEWVPRKGLKRVGELGQYHVRVFDNVNRVATPGDPIYAEATHAFALVALGQAPGADQISATLDGPTPVVRVAWDGAVPDNWRVTRDGEWLDDPDSTMEGAVMEYLDYTARPGVSHVYQALAVTDLNETSPNGPTVTITPRPPGVWLMSPDSDERLLILDQEVEANMTERAVIHTPVGDGQAIRRRSGTPPPWGTVGGLLLDSAAGDDYSAVALEAIARRFKDSDQGRVYRFVWGTWNIPVTIGDMTVFPVTLDDGRPAFEIAFTWWQTDWED